MRRLRRKARPSGDASPTASADPPAIDENRLSEPLSDGDLQRLYTDQVLTQEFYGDAYTPSLTAFVSDAAEDMAAAIVETFRPTRVLDVGCGLGQMVVALRRRGVDALGCDYSESFLRQAPEEARPYLRPQDVTELGGYGNDEFDLVLCMEVLEHLPVGLVSRCVDELRRVSRGPIVITTPSFGANWPGRHGLPLHDPSWREDALAGRRFRRIVIAPDGRPHHGHLTLASYAWWTRLFAQHRLVRNQDLENSWLESPERPLWHHRWNLYVLHEVTADGFVPGETCVTQGGFGWHPLEEWDGDRRVRWTTSRARAYVGVPCARPTLALTLNAGPDVLAYPRVFQVTARVLPLGTPHAARIRVIPGAWVELGLAGLPAREGDLLEVTIDTPELFAPRYLPDPSDDTRSLGVAVARIAAVSPEGCSAEAELQPVLDAGPFGPEGGYP